MRDLEVGDMTGERRAGEFGAVVGEHARDVHAEAAQLADRAVQEPGSDRRVGRTDEDLDDGPAGRGVDRGELPYRSDAFELADEEAVQGDQVTGVGGEVTEPERALERRLG